MSADDPTIRDRMRRYRARLAEDQRITDWVLEDMIAQIRAHTPYRMHRPPWVTHEEWGLYIDRESARRERRSTGRPDLDGSEDES